jgi:hypothetical protein
MVKAVRHPLQTILAVTRDLASLARSVMRSRAQLAAENLFLPKQLALFQERRPKPRRADDATRFPRGLSRLLAWRQLLVIVTPEALIRWHRQGFRLFWRWKSRAPGRPRIPADVQRLIDPPRMLGLHDSGERTARSRESSGVGPSLQPGPATRELGPGHSGGSILAVVVRAVRQPLGSAGCRVAATAILSGLHHEYRFERQAA